MQDDSITFMVYAVSMTCSWKPGCSEEKIFAKDLCRNHYYQQWRAARANDPDAPRCSEGDGKPVQANGLCSMHYSQQWRQGRPPPPECKEGDGKPVEARDWCERHYRHFLKYGDPNWKPDLVRDQLCSMGDGKRARQRWIVDGEERGVLCSTCCNRLRQHGHPAGGRRRAANGKGRHNHDGYINVTELNPDGTPKTRVSSSGRVRTSSRPEHCVFMEQLLGRPLEGDENVHHVNGVKTDNSTDGPLVNFRSGNLELWSTKQPKGQRVTDKIEFALVVLREYAPEFLSPQGRIAPVA